MNKFRFFLSDLEPKLSCLTNIDYSDIVNLNEPYPSVINGVPSYADVLQHDIDIGSAASVKQLSYHCSIIKQKSRTGKCITIQNTVYLNTAAAWSSMSSVLIKI